MAELHTHDDSKWRLPKVEWAPHGDQTVSTRLFAAAAEQCDECMPGLTAEAAQNGDTLAITILMAETLLERPEAVRCVPAPALQEVFARIRRMGNPDKTTVVGMLRTFPDAQRLDVAIACWRAVQDYMQAVNNWAETVILQRQRQPWWRNPRGN